MRGHTFVTAHFTNNERTTVESFWRDEKDEDIIRTEIIEAAIDVNGLPADSSPQWKELLNHIDIDTLHSNTAKHITEMDEAYQLDVIRIAKERGLLLDEGLSDQDLFQKIIGFLFSEFKGDNREDKEKLFHIKLQLFELEQIKNSKNRALKAELRKAKSIIEAIKYAIEIYLTEE